MTRSAESASGLSGLLRPGLLLALLALLGVGLLVGVHELTAERIADQERRALLARLDQVLPRDTYDNDLLADTRTWVVLAEGPEAGVDEVIDRQKATDPDLWVLELEDREGRHLLDAPGLAE